MTKIPENPKRLKSYSAIFRSRYTFTAIVCASLLFLTISTTGNPPAQNVTPTEIGEHLASIIEKLRNSVVGVTANLLADFLDPLVL